MGILAIFTVWERLTSHPMLRLEFFRNRSFSTAILSLSLVMFGLFGALFILTQYLQFYLHFTALATGVRIIPAAGAIAVIAPLSTLLHRRVGTRLIVSAGLLIVAAGLWQISTASVTSTYWGTLPGMIMLGVGAGLAIPAVTGTVIGSLPRRYTGIGSATNGAFLQITAPFGVAVIGSLLSTHYQNQMTPFLVPLHLPAAMQSTILGSIGEAVWMWPVTPAACSASCWLARRVRHSSAAWTWPCAPARWSRWWAGCWRSSPSPPGRRPSMRATPTARSKCTGRSSEHRAPHRTASRMPSTPRVARHPRCYG